MTYFPGTVGGNDYLGGDRTTITSNFSNPGIFSDDKTIYFVIGGAALLLLLLMRK